MNCRSAILGLTAVALALPVGCGTSGASGSTCRKDPRAANDTLEQVAREFGPQLAALEGTWGADTLSGFRDPMNAGHGEPLDNEPPAG